MADPWDELISLVPGAHFLQTREWAEIKKPVGWMPAFLTWQRDHERLNFQMWDGKPNKVDAAVMVLRRQLKIGPLRFPIKIAYAPRGPLLDWENEADYTKVLTDLLSYIREERAIYLKIDPFVVIGTGAQSDLVKENHSGLNVKSFLTRNGWVFSNEQVQFRNTFMLSLEPEEAELLAAMKQKTRYNIRLAGRKGVTVRLGSEKDMELLYKMYAVTSLRDGFVIREPEYYRRVWHILMQAGLAEILIAETGGESVAAVFLARFAKKAWFLYGMSLDIHREKMPNYLLQWEAIRRAKSQGCIDFDMWGAPDEFDEKDAMWGVYRFKEGFGGQVVRSLGAWDYPIYPRLYRLFTKLLPKILNIYRKRGFKQTQGYISP